MNQAEAAFLFCQRCNYIKKLPYDLNLNSIHELRLFSAWFTMTSVYPMIALITLDAGVRKFTDEMMSPSCIKFVRELGRSMWVATIYT